MGGAHDQGKAVTSNPIARLRAIGTALYGPYFQAELAQVLAVSPRTVRRWVAGDFNIPENVWDEIRPLLREREALLRRLRTELPA